MLVYQATYHLATYLHHHLRGQKQDFHWRLTTPDHLGRAGIDKIGLGALIGLSDSWRTDCYLLAEHLFYPQKPTSRAVIRSRFHACGPAPAASSRRRS